MRRGQAPGAAADVRDSGGWRRRPAIADEPLLERDGELDALEQALSAASRSEGRVVVIRGPAGVGKSRLLAVAADAAHAHGLRVLDAHGSELERDFPFGVALQLFEPVLASASPPSAAELMSGAARLASPLLAPEASALPSEDSGFSVIHGLYWLASNLCSATAEHERRRGLAMLVDDAQWADRASLRFLAYLAQRLDALPIAVLACVRSGEPSGGDELVAQIAAGPCAARLQPAPLSRSAVTGYVRGRLSPEADEAFCGACGQVTGGNPFLLRELLMELASEGVAPTAESADRVRRLAPESVLRAVLARLGRLPEGASALASALAVLGDETPLEAAASVSGVDVTRATALADLLAKADILRPGQPLQFVHPLIRAALYRDLAPHRRSAVHAAAARTLADRGEPVERIAAHLLASDAAPEPWAVEALRAAARDAARRGSPGVAVRFLERALTGAANGGLRSAILTELAAAESRAGTGAPTERLGEALDLLDDPAARARTRALLGRMLFNRGRHAEAAAAFEQALGELGDGDPAAARELEVAFVAAATLVPARRAEGLARLEPILDRLRAGMTPTEPHALAQLALRLAVAGEPAERACMLAERALESAALLDDLLAGGPAFNLAVSALIYDDELVRAQQALDAAVAHARAHGAILAVAAAGTWRAWSSYYQGRILEAIADAEQALDARRHGWSTYIGVSAAALAHARIERGELEAAAAALDVAAAIPAESPEHALLLDAGARLAMLKGRAGDALEQLRAAGETFSERFGVAGVGILPWRSNMALALTAAGDRDAALQMAAEELELARRVGAPRPIGIALRARGLVEGGAAGIEALGEAVATLSQSPARLEHLRALTELGGALRRAGQRTSAREPLSRALELAHRFGATTLATRAHEELRAAGARPRRLAFSGADSLTASERRVAGMAAQGMSNPEIAQALFITTKTVEMHLGRTYRKLAIRSRTELAGALTE